ncbi:unnamed protein product [Brassica rapa]|uniref:Uncharacterized protein n=1 Tax=Brassica campestris TaxID=3711 RepID=A0A8D9D9T4_BRACM|nr:unnamed protein product [Brassica rapa]
MNKDHEMPLIFGRTFMATVGATIDMPNKRVCFSNINKKVFYKAVPTRSFSSHASRISVFDVEKLKKVQKKRVKGDPTVTLIPLNTSKPFSKVRAILTHELKEKGEAAVKGLLSRVLKLNMSDCGACFGTGPPAQPD